LKRMSQVRRKLQDVSELEMRKLLDPNRDNTVSLGEFTSFLPIVGVDWPRWQAAALYETISRIVNETTLTLDSTLLCLALVSRDLRPANEWGLFAETLGCNISRWGGKTHNTLAGVFRLWDKDQDGFLSAEDLESGFKSLPQTEHISSEQVHDFVSFVAANGRKKVSVLEFIRALAPRSLSVGLQRAMLRETLKDVWLCRHSLRASVAQFDPSGTGKVSQQYFTYCVRAGSRELERLGRQPLTDVQVQAICEVASGGDKEVEYGTFFEALHVIDRNQTKLEGDCTIRL